MLTEFKFPELEGLPPNILGSEEDMREVTRLLQISKTNILTGYVKESQDFNFYVHTGSKNASFHKVAEILRSHGIVNCEFMLMLLDPSIAHLDPFSPTLTDSEKSRILAEALLNPWYFIRELVRIDVSGGKVSYELHLGNLFLTWCMISNINCYLVLPRQNYKTVSACAVYAWSYCLSTRNSHMLFFNKELKDSQNNLKRVKDIVENLPDWMRDGVIKNPNDRNAIEYIYSAERKNRIDPKPAGTSYEHADNLGRGNTVPVIWYDELAFMRFNRVTYMAAAPAQSQARAAARRMGVPYGTVITTTPNAVDTDIGLFAYQIRGNALRFRLEFYDLGPTEVQRLIDTEAKANFLYAEYTYSEIGRSEEWFKEQCKELLGDTMKIKREILLVWPMSSEGSVFTEDQLDLIKKFEKKYTFRLPMKLPGFLGNINLDFQFTKVFDPNEPYVLAIDTSGGVGRDYTALTLIDIRTNEAIGTARTNTMDDDLLKSIVKYLATMIFPKSILVIERNYLGLSLINYLVKTDIEPRIFYMDKERVAEKVVGKLVTKKKQKTRVYGVDTTVSSREIMFRHLFQIIQENPEIVTAELIQEEIRSLCRTKAGKIEHRPGLHDDVLMSWLIGVYAIRNDQPTVNKIATRLGFSLGRKNGKTSIVERVVEEVVASTPATVAVPAAPANKENARIAELLKKNPRLAAMKNKKYQDSDEDGGEELLRKSRGSQRVVERIRSVDDYSGGNSDERQMGKRENMINMIAMLNGS